MSKKRYNLVLQPGTDEAAFLSNEAAGMDVYDNLNLFDMLLCMMLTEEEAATLKTSEKVIEIEAERQAIETSYPTSTPRYETQSATFKTKFSPAGGSAGADYTGMNMFFTSEFDPAAGAVPPIGWFGDNEFNDTVKSNFLGEYVDIVAIEAGTPILAYNGHENHVDFQEFDSTDSKFVKMDWSDYNGAADSVSNNQISNPSGPFWTAHAAGVLSAAGGKYCGWGKKSTLRVIYLEDGASTAYYAVLQWHITKAVNPETGVRNATVVTGAWGYSGIEHEEFYRIEDIASMTVQGGGVTVTRPGGGWGSDLTPFTNNNIIPRVINDPADSTDKWMISVPNQSRFSTFDTIMNTYNNYNGIYHFKSAGNNAHIAVNPADVAWNDYITPDGGYRVLNTLDGEGRNQFTASSTSNSNQYVFRNYIDGGNNQFTIAACQQDDTNRLMDDYSNRGPMIDFAAYGAYTWTSYPEISYTDGNWGYFSGTSCAAPVAGGCAAVFIDWYFTQRGVYPSIAQLKALMIKHAKENLIGEDLINFASIPTAGNISSTKLYASSEVNRVKDNDFQNGGAELSELYGTPPLRVHIPWGIRMGSGKYIAGGSEQTTNGRRPLSGTAWPRRKVSFSS
jgi:hypothetical protein